MWRRFIIVAVTLAALTGGSLWAQSRSLEVQFKAAQEKEEVEGDLKGGLRAYETIAGGSNRELAAQALLRMADIHTRLGNAEANKVYERLIRDFKEQNEAVSIARARLGRPTITQTASAGPRFVPVPDLRGILVYGASVSPDGRYIAYAKPQGRTVVVRDISTGRERNVTPTATGTNGNMVTFPVFSKDGRQLAYTWTTEQSWELRVISLQESSVTRFRRLLSDRYIQPFDWTPDGKSIVAAINHHSNTAEISLVSVADGSTRTITPTDQWSAVFVSPDGKYVARDHRATATERQFDVFVLPIDGGTEVPVVQHSAEDRLVGWAPDGRHLLFTSDRGIGTPALYAQRMADGRPDGSRPILITTKIGTLAPVISGIFSFGVARSGALFYAGSELADTFEIQEIEIANFDFETGKVTAATVVGGERNGSNAAPAWSRDGKSLAFRSAPGGNTGSASVLIRSVDTGVTRDFRPNLEGISSLDWSPDGRALVTAVPAGRGAGIYRIDAQNGETSSIVLGSGKMQPVWSADGRSIYYRSTEAAGSVAYIARDVASGAEREIIRRPSLGNLILSPDGRYIATGVSDRATKTRVILLIPVAGGEPRVLKQITEPQDMGVKMWAPDSRSVIVVTVRPEEAWRLPLDGAPVRLSDDALLPQSGRPAVHPDGSRIAVVRRSTPSQASAPQPGVWVLENFLPKASK